MTPDSPSGPAPGPGQERLAEPLRSRWSPRILDEDRDVSDEEVATMLEAARWAPSWGNLQPWSFVVARRGGRAHGVLLPHLSRGNAGWVPRAPVVLLVAAQVAAAPGERPLKGEAHACYDTGQAAAHLSLQARALGLHAHQLAGFDHEAVAAGLGLPDHVRLLSAVAIGALGDPAGAPERDREREQRPRTRRPLAEFVHVDAWGTPWSGPPDPAPPPGPPASGTP